MLGAEECPRDVHVKDVLPFVLSVLVGWLVWTRYACIVHQDVYLAVSLVGGSGDLADLPLIRLVHMMELCGSRS